MKEGERRARWRTRGLFRGKNSGEEKVYRRREGRPARGWEARWTRYSNGIDGSLSLSLSLRGRQGGRSGCGDGGRERDSLERQLGIRGSGYRAEISRSQNKCRNRPRWHAPGERDIYVSAWQFRLVPRRVTCDGREPNVIDWPRTTRRASSP